MPSIPFVFIFDSANLKQFKQVKSENLFLFSISIQQILHLSYDKLIYSILKDFGEYINCYGVANSKYLKRLKLRAEEINNNR